MSEGGYSEHKKRD